MGAMQVEVYEAFRSIDVPDDKALEIATALSSALTRFETDTGSAFKRDTDTDAIRKDIGVLKTDMAVVKWMAGFVIVFQVLMLGHMVMH